MIDPRVPIWFNCVILLTCILGLIMAIVWVRAIVPEFIKTVISVFLPDNKGV